MCVPVKTTRRHNMKTAHFIAGKSPSLILSATLQPVGEIHPVKNKAEARKLAALHGAKPWNF